MDPTGQSVHYSLFFSVNRIHVRCAPPSNQYVQDNVVHSMDKAAEWHTQLSTCDIRSSPLNLRGSAHCRRPPAGSRIFGFLRFSIGIWGLGGFAMDRNGLQIDGFSAHIEPYESIFNDFHDGQFSVV